MQKSIMVFNFLKRRRDIEKKFSYLHDSLSDSFSKIKEDMQGVGEWIKHLDDAKNDHYEKLDDVDSRLKVVEEFIHNLTEQRPMEKVSKQLSKHKQTAVRPKQTGGVSKQLSKQSEGVQTDIEKGLFSLTAMERTVVWSLLNTDLLLSYGDMERILGKDQSTVRGQINNIKRKIPRLILEKSEGTGKKRFYINEEEKRDILIKYIGKKQKTIKSES